MQIRVGDRWLLWFVRRRSSILPRVLPILTLDQVDACLDGISEAALFHDSTSSDR